MLREREASLALAAVCCSPSRTAAACTASFTAAAVSMTSESDICALASCLWSGGLAMWTVQQSMKPLDEMKPLVSMKPICIREYICIRMYSLVSLCAIQILCIHLSPCVLRT